MLLQSDRVASDAIAEIKVVEAWTQSLQARCISCIPTLQDKTDLLFNGGRKMSLGNLCRRLAVMIHRSCRVLWRPSSIWSGDLSGQAGFCPTETQMLE